MENSQSYVNACAVVDFNSKFVIVFSLSRSSSFTIWKKKWPSSEHLYLIRTLFRITLRIFWALSLVCITLIWSPLYIWMMLFCCCFLLFRSVSHCLADRLHSYSHSLEEMDKRISIYWISWLRERECSASDSVSSYFFYRVYVLFCFVIKCVCGVCWKGVV